MIKFADPLTGFKTHEDNILSELKETLDSGEYILGQRVTRFEADFATYLDVNSVVGVNSGTDALEIALRALEVGATDEVITVSHTALATVSAILTVGATPVLVDICPLTFNMDVESLKSAISDKTKVIILVHLYGNPGPIEEVQEIARGLGIKVIEDCAQIAGGTYKGKRIGSFGDISAFSFYPTKNLGAFGDGGAVATSDLLLYEKAKKLRQYGWDDKRLSDSFGRNSRLDDMQASVLSYRLKQLDKENDRRRQIAELYCGELSSLAGAINTPTGNPLGSHVYHLFVTLLDPKVDRKQIMDFLGSQSIQSGIHYPVPVHLQTGYQKSLRLVSGGLPNTENIANNILSLPMHPWLTNEEVMFVSKSLRDFMEKL